MASPGDREAGAAHGWRDRRLVKLREHGEDGFSIAVFVAAELPRLAFDEREESDCVLRTESAQRLTVTRGDRRDHELQATVAESDRGIEGGS